jgi:hypothetical protein
VNNDHASDAIDDVVAAVAARLREQVVTQRLVVAARDGGPYVTVTADGSTAEIRVAAPGDGDRRPAVEIALHAAVDEHDALASASLVRGGDARSEWMVTAPAGGRDGVCQLVFDDAVGVRWLVLDRAGAREEPPIVDDS